MDNAFDAVILSACRTPIGSFGGALKDVSAVDLGAVVIREAIARASVTPADIGDVVMGCVLQAGAGMNVARQAALKAGLPVEVPGETVNRVCGSGLQAVVHAVEAIRVGYVDAMVAGGTESMSNAPYLLKGARWGYRMGNGEVVDSMLAEGLTCAIERLPHGHHRRGSRRALQRRRAPIRTRSRRRASAAPSRAIREGRFTDEIVPVDDPAEEGRPRSFRHRRVPARRDDRREAGGAQAGVQEGRDRSRPATPPASTTAQRRWSSPRRRRPKTVGTPPLARILAYVVDRRRSEDHGHRAGSSRAQGPRARGPEASTTSISSS